MTGTLKICFDTVSVRPLLLVFRFFLKALDDFGHGLYQIFLGAMISLEYEIFLLVVLDHVDQSTLQFLLKKRFMKIGWNFSNKPGLL